MGTRQVRHQNPATMTKASELSRHPGESIRGRRRRGWAGGRRAARDRRAPPILLRRRRSAGEAKTAALATNPDGEVGPLAMLEDDRHDGLVGSVGHPMRALPPAEIDPRRRRKPS
jgi:hypothetical protein